LGETQGGADEEEGDALDREVRARLGVLELQQRRVRVPDALEAQGGHDVAVELVEDLEDGRELQAAVDEDDREDRLKDVAEDLRAGSRDVRARLMRRKGREQREEQSRRTLGGDHMKVSSPSATSLHSNPSAWAAASRMATSSAGDECRIVLCSASLRTASAEMTPFETRRARRKVRMRGVARGKRSTSRVVAHCGDRVSQHLVRVLD